MFCKNCGNEVGGGVKFCAKCGAKLDTASEIKGTVSSDNIKNNATGHSYRFRCCDGVPGRMPIIALPLFYAIIYFTGDTVDFMFQEDTMKINSSKLNVEEPYENIKNIYFQDNVPFKRNFPLIVSIIISFLIVAVLTNSFESDVISILSIILTLGASLLLKFGKKKRTAITVEYNDGRKLCIPMKKLNEKQLHLKEQFLNDIESIRKESEVAVTAG